MLSIPTKEIATQTARPLIPYHRLDLDYILSCPPRYIQLTMTAKSRLITICKSMKAHRSTPAEWCTSNIDTIITVDYQATFSLPMSKQRHTSTSGPWPLLPSCRLEAKTNYGQKKNKNYEPKKFFFPLVFFSSKPPTVIFDDFMNTEPRGREKPRIRKSVLRRKTGTPAPTMIFDKFFFNLYNVQ